MAPNPGEAVSDPACGIGSQDFEPIVVSDSLAANPGDRFDLVRTNMH